MLNWDMMKNPMNYVVLTLMVLIGLMAFDAVKRWLDAPKVAADPAAPSASAS
jgi:hypothetical protein